MSKFIIRIAQFVIPLILMIPALDAVVSHIAKKTNLSMKLRSGVISAVAELIVRWQYMDLLVRGSTLTLR